MKKLSLANEKSTEKKQLAVIFGGQSNEHEISCMSVVNILKDIDDGVWDTWLIGITRDGRWLLAEDSESILDGSWRKSTVSAHISPDALLHGIVAEEEGKLSHIRLDAAFPVLHGNGGEDGTVQGLLELAKIPYVGCGVMSSAACMDKFYTKTIVSGTGIRQARFIGVRRWELKKEESTNRIISRAEEELGYPVFIKPSRSGSSVGVTRACDRSELLSGLGRAAAVDSKILIEEYIDGREIECAVFGGGEKKVFASGVGEILAAADFYDYDAKYNNPDSKTVTDPDLPSETIEEIRESACRIFNAMDGYGLARVDFFVEKSSGEVVFNEINTMPGFTAISMYPMLWEAAGISGRELMSMLLQNALEREPLL